ncbi:putative RNA methyltransferase At5g10620 [Selaginella moellendorffii]|uniref:putative RNA methyltransferase At5g10620 n=1 Tax=Selaginella moellendorffii TaxID=88036 RepID=UPI000D1C9539|nr:putative RNA methyltransferase At5g10620 [Selaginella moellendorffii]|eukprot:XP_024536349.1 putative RNA methyltransferase At5g10620 [Selaginella moellendorffii]
MSSLRTSSWWSVSCASARSVRPAKIKVLTVGKSPDPGVQMLLDGYSRKIQRYCGFQVVQVRPNPKNSSDPKVQIEAESENAMRNISTSDWVAVLDESGRDVTSLELADLIADAANNCSSSLLFCIGGPYGHGSRVKTRANVTLRLSSLVLNHQVALIVLVEQIYRSWTILRGENYHH